jgi:hypothetical protein
MAKAYAPRKEWNSERRPEQGRIHEDFIKKLNENKSLSFRAGNVRPGIQEENWMLAFAGMTEG